MKLRALLLTKHQHIGMEDASYATNMLEGRAAALVEARLLPNHTHGATDFTTAHEVFQLLQDHLLEEHISSIKLSQFRDIK